MSDRRSFSEIPTDLLREHGVDARVDRVWKRLDADLTGHRRPKRATPLGWVLVSASMFALGLIVGTRWNAPAVLPVASPVAEPVALLPRVAAGFAGSRAPSETSPGLRPSKPLRRGSVVRPADTGSVATTAPAEEPESKNASEWQRLAEEGEYVQALAALESSGGFDVALGSATTDELMSLVDVARATGQRERAVLALRRIVNEHGSDPTAPVAAWMLGNELFKAHDLAGAEQAFAKYRALSPGGDFAEDALARQIDMASEQGNLDRARGLAEQYLKEFPDGPRTADIQSELGRWGRDPKAAAPGEEPKQVPSDPANLDAGALR